MPASMRSVVVLPAPSGPTSPKISPARTSKLSASTAHTPGKLLVSPAATIADWASHCSLACAERTAAPPTSMMRVGRHARLQLVIRIVDVDLDAIDQRHPLLVRLHALGRELSIGRDERNAPVILLAGIGVGGDRLRPGPSECGQDRSRQCRRAARCDRDRPA